MKLFFESKIKVKLHFHGDGYVQPDGDYIVIARLAHTPVILIVYHMTPDSTYPCDHG